MNFSILLLLLIGHFVGDYYLQSDEIANTKDMCKKSFLKHCFLYTISMIVVITPYFTIELLLCSLSISLLHLIVDLIKSYGKKGHRENLALYLRDQVIHLLVILGFSLFISQRLSISYLLPIQKTLELYGLNELKILSLILSFLIIMNPSAITIKIVLEKYGSIIKDEKEGVPNTGALIGKLERCIIFLMLILSQYAAIGFILTAKSVARYKKIIDDVRFSEYYLLGTFLSTLIVILTYIIVLKPFF